MPRSRLVRKDIIYAGELDQRIVLQEKTETQARQSGNPVPGTPAQQINVAAHWEDLGSREFPIVEKRFAETTARCRIRYRPGITGDGWEIVFRGKTWDIKPPLVIGRNIGLIIEVSEVV